ncbi:M23 family metallopeptidase [Thermoactinomyces sp. CICC 23799]|uniref:murein hydrolase activator EnvC family protein n=1 Tax=Thermoactinomyces sp. CICC 23799 TaxID=2767429 RepID=UPI0018DD8546|nr:peptidoglycan DD-metalloendopeptidase family protein [Thermoactinomyces sp. CICC 23799]
MIRKEFAGIFSFLLVFSLIPVKDSFAITDSSSIDEKKEEIRQRDQEIMQLEKKKELAQEDMKQLLGQIEAKKKELNRLDMRVYALENQIKEKQEERKNVERELDLLRQTYKHRMQDIYLKGNNFYFELLLQSNSIGDFLKRYDYISILARADQRVIQKYTGKQKELAGVEQELREDLANLQTAQKEAQGVFAQLQKKYRQHEGKLAALETNLAELEDQNIQARKELRNRVAKLEEEARKKEQQNHPDGNVPSSDGFLWPVNGTVTSPFGMRYHPVHREYRMHEGMDIAAKMGTPIRAASSGEVIEARPSKGYGYVIVIYHGNGLSTLYAHMYAQTVKVEVGQKVSAGDVIAAVGSNGFSTGPHLHFEVHKGSTPVDPASYLPPEQGK